MRHQAVPIRAMATGRRPQKRGSLNRPIERAKRQVKSATGLGGANSDDAGMVQMLSYRMEL